MQYVAKRCIGLRGTRRATSGFQRIGIFCICGRGVWSSRSPGQSWAVTTALGFYSLVVSKAEYGLGFGAAGVCRISRMVSFARRTQSLMGWARVPLGIFDPMGMGRCGLQRRRVASAG